MNVLKQTFNRAKQTLEENFGDAAKTEYDVETSRCLQKADDIKEFTEKIVSAVEVFLQPDPAVRMLPGLTQEGLNKAETVGQEMTQFAASLGPKEGIGAAFLAVGEVYTNIGHQERDFLAASQQIYIIPMRRFLQEDLKTLEQERKTLTNRRLDMDALKTKAQKNPTDSAVLQELGKSQTAFDEQVRKVKDLVGKLEKQLPELQKHLKQFVQRHQEHLAKCEQALTDVQKKL